MPLLATSLRAMTDPSFRDRLRWAVRVRWLVIVGFLGLGVLAHAGGLFVSLLPCLLAAGAATVMNTLNHWSVARWQWVLPVTLAALSVDLIGITYVTLHTGGVHSPFISMYVLQVLATAMLVDTAVAAVTAALAGALFGAALTVDALGVYHGQPVGPPAIEHSAVYRVAWSAFFFYALGLLVYLGGYISQRLGASERDLAEKNRRLEDAVAQLGTTNRELVSAYERLKQTEAHLIQSEKMHALGQLVAGVAHELNNPISFVSANIEHLRLYVDRLTQLLNAYDVADLPAAARDRIATLKQELRLPELLADLPGLLNDCEEGAQRTKRIVTELRTFSRSDEYDRWRRIDVHQCIESTLALLSYRLKNHVAVHRDFGNLPEIECLPGQINQVLMNLLANAADAVGNAGNIWLTTRASTSATTNDQPEITISVRDDGGGIAPAAQAHIFDPFFTTKDVGKGTGLGLSVSYSIVARHNGSLHVESEPGHGATFVLRLPVQQPPAAA